jgi:hypothetical protein
MAQNIHEYTVQEASNLGLGQGGVFTISDTNIHDGRYVRLQCVTNTVFHTLTEDGTGANGFVFTSGSVEPADRAMLVGNTSGAKASVVSTSVTSGSWAGTDAAGTIQIIPISGTFSASETVSIIADTKTISSDALTTATAANGGVTASGTIVGSSIPAGTIIDGVFTRVKLTSGIVRGYKG